MGKLAIVQEISTLCNDGLPLETVGPGSTERKSVFVRLATALGIDTTGSKPALAARIVQSGGLVWDTSCESIGDTITTTGLQRCLEVARKELV